jgi:cell wall-associated NlpC family hydrolase
MLRKFLLAPVMFFVVIGIIGVGFGHTAFARTTNTLTSPVATIQNKNGTEQELQKSTESTKGTASSKKETITKRSVKKKSSSARHGMNKKHAGQSSKKSPVAKGATKKKSGSKSVVASNKHHQRINLAKHSRNNAKHRHAIASKPDNTPEAVSSTGLTPGDPIDLWLVKDAPERIRQGLNDGDIDDQTLKVLESAYSYLGTPYRYGGTTPHGFDCSGFVRQVFSENGISLGRSSRDQALDGKKVSLSDLKPGDLIFFNMNRRNRLLIDHVGLYVGNGQFIHAASRHSGEIKIEDLDTERYLHKIVQTRRVLEYTR